MNDGIDYKKIETCMVEIYGLSDYNGTSKTLLLYNKIRFLTASGIPILTDIKPDVIPGGPHERDEESTHIKIIVKSIGETHEDYPELYNNGQFPAEVSAEEMDASPDGYTVEKFLKNTKMCRVHWRGYVREDYLTIELNVLAHQLLTDSQRKVILDIIEVSGVSPDKIYIDDHSEEQSIKRQLGLQFF